MQSVQTLEKAHLRVGFQGAAQTHITASCVHILCAESCRAGVCGGADEAVVGNPEAYCGQASALG